MKQLLGALALLSLVLVLVAFTPLESDSHESTTQNLNAERAYVMNFGRDGEVCRLVDGESGVTLGHGLETFVRTRNTRLFSCHGSLLPDVDPPDQVINERDDVCHIVVTPGGTFSGTCKWNGSNL